MVSDVLSEGGSLLGDSDLGSDLGDLDGDFVPRVGPALEIPCNAAGHAV